MGVESKAAARERIAQQRSEIERREAKERTQFTRIRLAVIGGGAAAFGVFAITATNTVTDGMKKDIAANKSMDGIQTNTASETSQTQVVSSPPMHTQDYALGVFEYLFGAALLIGAFAVAKRKKSKGKLKVESAPSPAASEPSFSEQWKALDERRDTLMVQWSRYETDVALMIDYPIMTDYTDPIIGKVITAMQEMCNAEIMTGDRSKTPVHGSAMLSAVNKFEFALLAAEKHARRYGQSKLSQREQRKLSAARTALNIILDGEAPVHEVEAAYKSLRGSLVGIIDLQPEAVIALEKKVRRELTTA